MVSKKRRLALRIALAALLVTAAVAGAGHLRFKPGKGLLDIPMFSISLVQPKVLAQTTFPVQDAYMSAYIKLETVDLSKLTAAFSNLKTVTTTYVLGGLDVTIAVGSLGTYKVSPRFYADTGGWVVVYFTDDSSLAYLMDWSTVDLGNPKVTSISTTLEKGMKQVTDALGLNFSDVKPLIKYYDFRSGPNYDKVLWVAKTVGPSSWAYITSSIPNTYSVRPGTVINILNTTDGYTRVLVDGGEWWNPSGRGPQFFYGSSSFSLSGSHTIQVKREATTGYGAVVIIIMYKEG